MATSKQTKSTGRAKPLMAKAGYTKTKRRYGCGGKLHACGGKLKK